MLRLANCLESFASGAKSRLGIKKPVSAYAKNGFLLALADNALQAESNWRN